MITHVSAAIATITTSSPTSSSATRSDEAAAKPSTSTATAEHPGAVTATRRRDPYGHSQDGKVHVGTLERDALLERPPAAATSPGVHECRHTAHAGAVASTLPSGATT